MRLVDTFLILGRGWSELAELFPGWWSAKWLEGLHDIILMVYRLQCCGYYIYFSAQAECRNFLSEDYNKKIKQPLRGGKKIPYKIIQVLFLFFCHICCLCSKLMLFYWLPFLLVSGLVLRIIPSKVSQECTAIQQLKVHNISVVWKLVGHPP